MILSSIFFDRWLLLGQKSGWCVEFCESANTIDGLGICSKYKRMGVFASLLVLTNVGLYIELYFCSRLSKSSIWVLLTYVNCYLWFLIWSFTFWFAKDSRLQAICNNIFSSNIIMSKIVDFIFRKKNVIKFEFVIFRNFGNWFYGIFYPINSKIIGNFNMYWK